MRELTDLSEESQAAIKRIHEGIEAALNGDGDNPDVPPVCADFVRWYHVQRPFIMEALDQRFPVSPDNCFEHQLESRIPGFCSGVTDVWTVFSLGVAVDPGGAETIIISPPEIAIGISAHCLVVNEDAKGQGKLFKSLEEEYTRDPEESGYISETAHWEPVHEGSLPVSFSRVNWQISLSAVTIEQARRSGISHDESAAELVIAAIISANMLMQARFQDVLDSSATISATEMMIRIQQRRMQ